MKEASMLKCTHCGSTLELSVGYDGCDWNSIKGAGSEFDYEISLCCPKMGCGRVYPIGRIKNHNDFSENLEEYRPYKTDSGEQQGKS